MSAVFCNVGVTSAFSWICYTHFQVTCNNICAANKSQECKTVTEIHVLSILLICQGRGETGANPSWLRGERRGKARASCQSIEGLTQRNRQPFTLAFRHMGKLQPPIDLMCMSLSWKPDHPEENSTQASVSDRIKPGTVLLSRQC